MAAAAAQVCGDAGEVQATAPAMLRPNRPPATTKKAKQLPHTMARQPLKAPTELLQITVPTVQKAENLGIPTVHTANVTVVDATGDEADSPAVVVVDSPSLKRGPSTCLG